MKERLPSYAVKCFLAAGYDAPDVISSMNITEEWDNSIEVIEKFIDQHYRGHEEYYNNPILASHPFVFPPGHKIRIRNFVSEVKRLCFPTKIINRKSVGSKPLATPLTLHQSDRELLKRIYNLSQHQVFQTRFVVAFPDGLRLSLVICLTS